jgi:hypothetical protein
MVAGGGQKVGIDGGSIALILTWRRYTFAKVRNLVAAQGLYGASCPSIPQFGGPSRPWV